MRIRFLLWSLVALACSRGGKPETKPSEPAPEPAPERIYAVKSDDVLAPYKRTVTVTLTRTASRAEIEAISREIQSLKSARVERTYIDFDLQGVPPPKPWAHWATARFDPDLIIQINGDEPN